MHTLAFHSKTLYIFCTRFIQGILNVEGNDGMSAEHTSLDVKKTKSVSINNVHEPVALFQKDVTMEVTIILYVAVL